MVVTIKTQSVKKTDSPSHSHSDVLIVQEDGELDEEEDKLCNPLPPSPPPRQVSSETALLRDACTKTTLQRSQELETSVESELLAVNTVSQFHGILPKLTELLGAEALNCEGGRLQSLEMVDHKSPQTLKY